MDYYKATERYLYNYRSLKVSIKNMQQELVEVDYRGTSAVDYKEEQISKTNRFHSATEEEAIRVADKKEILSQRITLTEGKLQRIDRAIEALNPIERQVIEEKYFNGRQWWEIAYEVKFSERWCKEMRKRAVRKVAIGLFGEKALPDYFPNTARRTG